jgi:hypothetical protein
MSNTSDLSKLKLADLKALCKEKALPVSGTKAELIQRLSGDEKVDSKPKAKAKPKPVPAPLQRPVFQQFLDKKPIIIKRNIHGNFEHPETHLVFSTNKKIIGVQNPLGQIDPLTIQDLQNVYKYHFEVEDGIKVQDTGSNQVIKDESLKEKRVQELINMTIESTP